MNIIDLRKNLLQSPTAKRVLDRRKLPYKFGTPEWLDYMKQHDLEIPAEDRRKADRRNEASEPESARLEKNHTRFFLTPGEKRLLADLYLLDLEQ